MTSRMEMIFIDSDGHARKTGVGAIMDTPADTWRAFLTAKRFDVGADADFLLDYYNRKGDLADTIGLRRRDFERITGEKARTDAEYREIDRKYWADAMAELRAQKEPTP